MAPDSSRVMSSRLAMKRFSRSASSMHGARAAPRLAASSSVRRQLLQRAGRADDRGERRLQVVRDRGQQRRAQAVGLGRELGLVDILDKLDALDRERRLVGQRVEQPPLLGREQRTLACRCRCRRRRRAARPVRSGRKRRLAPGSVSAPRPAARSCSQAQLGGGEVGLVERVLGRIAGLDGDRAVFGQEQHDPHLEHRGDLEGGGPQHVVERAGAGELLAEQIEVLGRPGPGAGGDRLARARAPSGCWR